MRDLHAFKFSVYIGRLITAEMFVQIKFFYDKIRFVSAKIQTKRFVCSNQTKK